MSFKTVLLTLLIFIMPLSFANNSQKWSYTTGPMGPQHWGGSCQSGQQQSPIDITAPITSDAELASTLKIHYGNAQLKLHNTGRRLQINIIGKNTLSNMGSNFTLSALAYHTPSENTINGKHYAAELQFTNTDNSSKTTVLAVFIQPGEGNPIIADLLAHASTTAVKNTNTTINSDLRLLLPQQQNHYYSFLGSLTTPPCNESVNWIVMQNPISASAIQLKQLQQLFGKNNRPIQSRNKRSILKF